MNSSLEFSGASWDSCLYSQTLNKAVTEAKSSFLKTFELFKESEQKVYTQLRRVGPSNLKKPLHEYYLKTNGFKENFIGFILNSYSPEEFCELFKCFLSEFSIQYDQNIGKEQLTNSLEAMAQNEFLGKEKLKEAIELMGVKLSRKHKLFMEGSASRKLLEPDTAKKVFRVFRLQKDSQRLCKKNPPKENLHVDSKKLFPWVLVLFLEYQFAKMLNQSYLNEKRKGVPMKVSNLGEKKPDFSMRPFGLYKAFGLTLNTLNLKFTGTQLKDIEKALDLYKNFKSSPHLSYDSVSRIIEKVKTPLGIDKLSRVVNHNKTLSELLNTLTYYIGTEIVQTNYTLTNLEKYNRLVLLEWCTSTQTNYNLEKLLESNKHLEYTFEVLINSISYSQAKEPPYLERKLKLPINISEQKQLETPVVTAEPTLSKESSPDTVNNSMVYQAKKNQIDTKLELRKTQKRKPTVNNAFPNNKDIHPKILLDVLKETNNSQFNSKNIQDFQDLFKCLYFKESKKVKSSLKEENYQKEYTLSKPPQSPNQSDPQFLPTEAFLQAKQEKHRDCRCFIF